MPPLGTEELIKDLLKLRTDAAKALVDDVDLGYVYIKDMKSAIGRLEVCCMQEMLCASFLPKAS